MNDIFLSYAHEDEKKARLLAQALESYGWTVFWDLKLIPTVNWRNVIKEKISNSSCVIVLWSKYSIESLWVLEEAEEAQRRNIIVPVLIQNVEIPFGFRTIQAADLIRWNGSKENEKYKILIESIKGILPIKDYDTNADSTVGFENEVPGEIQKNNSKSFLIYLIQTILATAIVVFFQVMSLQYSTGHSFPWNKTSLIICVILYIITIIASFIIKNPAEIKFIVWQRRISIWVPILTLFLAALSDATSEGDLIQVMSLPFIFVLITGIVTIVKISQSNKL